MEDEGSTKKGNRTWASFLQVVAVSRAYGIVKFVFVLFSFTFMANLDLAGTNQ